MASGTVHSLTFTPSRDGIVTVTCNYEARGVSGGDFGSSYFGRAFLTQNGVTSFSDTKPCSTARLPYSLNYNFSALGGLPLTCGLFGQCNGATSVSFWNIAVAAQILKK